MRLLSPLLAAVLACSCLHATASTESVGPPAPARVDREMQLRTDMRLQIEAAWRADDFKALEAMGQDILQHRSKTFNGLSRLAPYYYDINQLLHITWPSAWNISGAEQENCRCKAPDPARYDEADRRWEAVARKLAAWSQQYPNSSVAPVARIKYLVNRAWFYRGSAYADKVNPLAWSHFFQYIGEADKTVRASRAIGAANPEWYGDAAQVAVAADWPNSEREQLYAEMPKHAQLYPVAYSTALQLMQPKWNGSIQSMHELIANTLQQAPKDDGLEFYARLYWVLLEANDKTLKAQSQAEVNRAMLKDGFNIILQRYPEPWNYLGAAKTACRIGDQAMFEQATRWLGTYERFQGKPVGALDCANDDFSPEKPVAAH